MDYYKLKVLNNKRKIIVSIGIIIVVLLFGGYYFFYYNKKDDDVILKDNVEEKDILDERSQNIYVDIKGHVEKPGVYSFNLNEDARINDLILKAGGLKKEADTSMINLSRKLEDEMTVVIYSLKEVNDYLNGQNELQKKLILCEEKIKNNACITLNTKDSKLININNASKEELMTLSGIGEAKANSIIEYRSKSLFKDIEELKNIDGIGENLFESIKNNITV